MLERKRLKKGEAKIQFVACNGRISELRGAGLDIQAIYERLVIEKLVTMSYGGFYEVFTSRQEKRSRKKRAEAGSPQVERQQSAPARPLPLVAVPAAAPLSSSTPVQEQKNGWSTLEKRMAAINAEFARSGKKLPSGSSSELENYQESDLF